MYFFIDKYRYTCNFHWQIQVSRYCLSKDLRMGVVITFWWRSQLGQQLQQEGGTPDIDFQFDFDFKIWGVATNELQ